MLITLVAVLSVVAQAPAALSPQGPVSVLIAPPDATGAPAHIVEFAQEHLAEQLESRGMRVIRIENITRKLPAARRKVLLRCKRTEAPCLQWLGKASKAEVVLVAELGLESGGYRAGVRAYTATDGALISKNFVANVPEDRLLDALTQALDVVAPDTQRALRGLPPAPPIDDVPPPTRPAPRPSVKDVPPPPEIAAPPPTLVEPAPVVTTKSSARRWAWLPAAGGVALAGVGTVFYLKAKDRYDTLEKATVDAPVRDSKALVSEGKQAQTVSRVTLGLGAAGLIAGAVMFLWPDDPPAQPLPSVSVSSSGAMVGLSGTWP